jgi:hypothetical protein
MKFRHYKKIGLALILALILSGCYGNFSLTKKLYDWNGTIDDKFLRSGLTWVLIIVQIYTLAGLFDFLFLNLVEFWSGTNPLSMDENQSEEQYVERGGQWYRITASKNRFDVEPLTQEGDQEKSSLIYDPQQKVWFMESGDTRMKVAEVQDEHLVKLIKPDQETLLYDTKQGKLVN